MNRLADVVRNARKRLRMDDGRTTTQEDLASLAGVAPATIAQIENGRTQRPERATLTRIAAALRISYNDLAIAAGMADPPTERDVEAEMRRISALSTVEQRMDALRVLSPEMYDLVQAWALDLVRRAGESRGAGPRRGPPGQTPDSPKNKRGGQVGT